MMICNFGNHSNEQFIQKNPVWLWAACSSKGTVLHVQPHCGCHTCLVTFKMEQWPHVFVGLITVPGITEGAHIFFDLFTSFEGLKWLENQRLKAMGTVRMIQIVGTPVPGVKHIEKEERGYSTAIWLASNENKGLQTSSLLHPGFSSQKVIMNTRFALCV